MGGGINIPDLLSMAASSSIPQPGTQNGGQSPTTFGPAPLVPPPPPVRFQPPQTQTPKAGNEFQTASGNKRATTQALFHNIAGLVKAGGDYVTAKKTRTLQMQIGSILEATQARDEAQNALKANPNDPEAKKALEFNTGRINDLTKDPKINKQLQKAFSIDLFGQGKNKQENQALIGAWQDYNKKRQAGDKTALNPAAQRLMQSRPQVQQLNPQLQQQAMLIQKGLIPDANHQSTATWQNLKTYSEAKSKEDEIASREKVAGDMVQARLKGYDKQYQAAASRYMSNEKIAEANRSARIKVAQIQASEWDKRIDILRKQSSNNPVLKSLYGEANTINTEMKTLATENEKGQTELDKRQPGIIGSVLGLSAVSKADSTILRNKIDTNNLRMQTLQGQLDEVKNKMLTLNKMGLLDPNAGGNTPNDAPLNDDKDDITVTHEDMNESQ